MRKSIFKKMAAVTLIAVSFVGCASNEEAYTQSASGNPSGFRDTVWGMSAEEVNSLETLELVSNEDNLSVYVYPKEQVTEFEADLISDANDNIALAYIFDYKPDKESDKYDVDGLYQIMIQIYFDSEDTRNADLQNVVDEFNGKYGDSESAENGVGVILDDSQKTWKYNENSYVLVQPIDSDGIYELQVIIGSNDYLEALSEMNKDDLNAITVN